MAFVGPNWFQRATLITDFVMEAEPEIELARCNPNLGRLPPGSRDAGKILNLTSGFVGGPI